MSELRASFKLSQRKFLEPVPAMTSNFRPNFENSRGFQMLDIAKPWLFPPLATS